MAIRRKTLELILSKPTYNRLTLTGEHYSNEHRQRLVEAICECGTIKFYPFYDLKRTDGKATKSCGCFNMDRIKKHGMWGTPFYKVFENIKSRCNNPNMTKYEYYGGRGIKVEWGKFEEFYTDMFSTYKKGLQLDRLDNDGNYSKENCAWVTAEENHQHTSGTYKLSLGGKQVSLAKFCRETGLSPYDKYRRHLQRKKITLKEIQKLGEDLLK